MKVGPPEKAIRLLSAKLANSRNFSGIERSYLTPLPGSAKTLFGLF